MKLLTVDAVADRLSISSVTVRRLIADGKLPSVRPSPRTVRVPEEAVETLISGRAVRAAAVRGGVAR
jgi:excisionase family DNA binding protein